MSPEKMKDIEAHSEDFDHMFDAVDDHTYSTITPCQHTLDSMPEYATISVSYNVTCDDTMKVRPNVAYGIGNIARGTDSYD